MQCQDLCFSLLLNRSLICENRLQIMIAERLYQMCKAGAWITDLVSQFPNYENYCKLGTGTVIFKENIILSGASSTISLFNLYPTPRNKNQISRMIFLKRLPISFCQTDKFFLSSLKPFSVFLRHGHSDVPVIVSFYQLRGIVFPYKQHLLTDVIKCPVNNAVFCSALHCS